MVNIITTISFITALISLLLGGFLLYRYFNYSDKVVTTVTESSGVFTATIDGDSYKVEKTVGLLSPSGEERTLMYDKDKKLAYVVPFKWLDYRTISISLIMLGLFALIMGVVSISTKSSNDGYITYDGSCGMASSCGMDDDDYDNKIDYSIYGI